MCVLYLCKISYVLFAFAYLYFYSKNDYNPFFVVLNQMVNKAASKKYESVTGGSSPNVIDRYEGRGQKHRPVAIW